MHKMLLFISNVNTQVWGRGHLRLKTFMITQTGVENKKHPASSISAFRQECYSKWNNHSNHVEQKSFSKHTSKHWGGWTTAGEDHIGFQVPVPSAKNRKLQQAKSHVCTYPGSPTGRLERCLNMQLFYSFMMFTRVLMFHTLSEWNK